MGRAKFSYTDPLDRCFESVKRIPFESQPVAYLNAHLRLDGNSTERALWFMLKSS